MNSFISFGVIWYANGEMTVLVVIKIRLLLLKDEMKTIYFYRNCHQKDEILSPTIQKDKVHLLPSIFGIGTQALRLSKINSFQIMTMFYYHSKWHAMLIIHMAN